MRVVACPYFLPREKSPEIYWPFPRRLPLGAGFCGSCTASGEPRIPTEAELREFCNLGYARGCTRLPAERRSDAVRFAVAKDGGDRILLHYCCERDYAPIEHGQLQYDCSSASWPVPHSDARIQRQAECYVGIYLERKIGNR
ncbi:MAG TPA: hypothetical protein VKD65_15015 [Candidatus Angelobacter sp.]|nr:hypothetical protein [Candidatus Angelobacter sp.]